MMRLIVLGDIVVPDGYSEPIKIGEGVTDILAGGFAIANLEGPVSQRLERHYKAGSHISQNELILQGFTKALHLQAVSLANNHIFDYGREGLNSTFQFLRKQGIAAFGAGNTSDDVYQPLILQEGFVKIAFFGVGESQFGCCKYPEYNPGFASLMDQQLFLQIRKFKESGHTIIIYAHAGLEMFELPLPEWRMHYKMLIDEGADLIIGSHPHLIQGKEQYKNRWIYYSLGNFFFPNNEFINNPSQFSLGLEIEVGTDIEVKEHFFQGNLTKVDLIKEYKDFDRITEMLRVENERNYLNQVNQEVLSHWRSYYQSYFGMMLTNKNFDQLPWFMKKIMMRLARKYFTINGNIMTQHNLAIETHRFAVNRAVSQLNKTY